MINKGKIAALLILLFTSLGATAQKENPLYDKAMADSLGGDDNGMKKYVLVILKTGPREETDKAVRDSLFRGHMNNITRMVNEGKLVIAGPLLKNEKNYRGIFILNMTDMEAVKKELDNDPAIKEKIFELEMFQWFGSAAISTYLKNHDKIQKKKN